MSFSNSFSAPVPMSTIPDGLMASTGMVVNDLMLTNTGSVTTVGGSSGGQQQSLGGVLVGGSVDASLVAHQVVADNAVVGMVGVTTSSSALMAALNGGPMMAPGGSIGANGVQGVVVGCEVKAGNVPVAVGQQQQQQPPASIPQEIATMSEHDLISYINPNCFEQGE